MPARRTLHLSVEEREALEDLRDHAPKPYLRERAAALLLIASGVPPSSRLRGQNALTPI